MGTDRFVGRCSFFCFHHLLDGEKAVETAREGQTLTCAY